ncbi:hypothetical protein FA15DRAFT_675993 [Coprinopsis marcescibilis]|uniref:Nuclear pore complex protein Nup85 n=1 Tax=Coprinopsis marcescibilis TaxID=230819 RepID=A0A5C3KCR7_COPMA|nr:hypothetical protein FA15DRAFT_675993 [Coprinopsis marcescibilis]
MPQVDHLDLVPALVGPDEFNALVSKGQTISVAASPLNDSHALFITPTYDHALNAKSSDSEDQPIYFISLHGAPSSERRLFITDTLAIFTAMRDLKNSAKSQPQDWLQSDSSITVLRKLGIDYSTFIKECWVHASQPIPRDGPLQFPSDHYRSLFTCFSLFVILFTPEPGYEQAPVGDELMEWLNTHFIEPSTEEGDHLSSLDKPWEDETFWPYLTRAILRGLTKAAVFFLETLSTRTSQDLIPMAETLQSIVQSQPRLQNFTTEREFAQAIRRWKDKVKALRVDMDRIPESKRFDEFENWWERLSDIVGILEGRAEVVKRVCEDLGADWKEVCVAWGIFVDPRLRRQDLPDVVADVLMDMPPDPTSLEDNIHAALFSSSFPDALEHSFDLDPWLSAHLADLMEALSLLEPPADEDLEMSLRDFYVLSYAEYLHSDPALWRITVDYMYACGEIGKKRGDEVLLRVPLKLHQTNNPSADSIRAGDITGTLKDINESCLQYQRETVRRTVCNIASQIFIQEKNYGLAASYSTSAENWTGLGRIVDYVLEEYIQRGPQPFIEYASAIAPIIPTLTNQPKINGVFYHRMIFAARYARLHELLGRHEFVEAALDIVTIFQEDVAPSSWWAVVLCDSVPLLEYEPRLLFSSPQASLLLLKLEEVIARASHGASTEYLSTLLRTIPNGNTNAALHRLQVVRLALARYFARCTVLKA